MEMICFFIVISCAIYGAWEILRFIYGGVISLLEKIYKKRGGSGNRRT